MFALAKWTHRIDACGKADTRLRLADGTVLSSHDIRAVLNRIQWLPAPRFRRASEKDRDYACGELQALVASWLAELGDRVVPSVQRHPCIVPSLPRLRWASAAAASGVPVHPQRMTTSPRHAAAADARVDHSGMRCTCNNCDVAADAETVLVAGLAAGGALAANFGDACKAAAARLALPLLEFRFARCGHERALCAVDSMPALAEPWSTDLASAFLASLATGEAQ
jgi:hypothetical protein